MDIKPYSKNPEKAQEYAIEDCDGVRNADAFILLTNELIGGGVSSELGVAVATHLIKGKPLIYIVGPHADKNFFYFHPTVKQFDTIEKVYDDRDNEK